MQSRPDNFALAGAKRVRQQSPRSQRRGNPGMSNDSAADLKSDALHFHREPRPGKLEITATKPLANQRDLALAYSPGVAFACEAIEADPDEAANLTTRQNLVAVLTNGTAVLGLGAIGPLAAKPVMEGKAVLFKKFAGIDVFDIEVNENNVDKLVDIIVRARAHLRRHQSRGHQGAGVFRGRGEGEGSHEHSRLPRRSARHRDHRLGGGHQCAGTDRQDDR